MSVSALWTTTPEVRGTDTLTRREIVRPGMCGHNSLFVGQVGDWTFEVEAVEGNRITRLLGWPREEDAAEESAE